MNQKSEGMMGMGDHMVTGSMPGNGQAPVLPTSENDSIKNLRTSSDALTAENRTDMGPTNQAPDIVIVAKSPDVIEVFVAVRGRADAQCVRYFTT